MSNFCSMPGRTQNETKQKAKNTIFVIVRSLSIESLSLYIVRYILHLYIYIYCSIFAVYVGILLVYIFSVARRRRLIPFARGAQKVIDFSLEWHCLKGSFLC